MASVPGTSAYSAAANRIGFLYFFSALSSQQAGGPNAATNFGTDFKVGEGIDSWQIQIHYEGIDPIAGSGTDITRVRVTILLHHLIFGVDDTPAQRRDDVAYFMVTHIDLARTLFAPAQWRTFTHVYDVAGDPDEDKDGDMETEDIGRVGDVLTWKYSITLLVDSL